MVYIVKDDYVQHIEDTIVKSYPGFILIDTTRTISDTEIYPGIDAQKLYDDNLSDIKTATEKRLMDLVDSRQNDIEKMILGYKATRSQIERYKDKYERAVGGEWDTATNNLIISNFISYRDSLRGFIDIVEYFRSLVDDLIILNNLDKANKIIDNYEQLPLTATIADIDALFI